MGVTHLKIGETKFFMRKSKEQRILVPCVLVNPLQKIQTRPLNFNDMERSACCERVFGYSYKLTFDRESKSIILGFSDAVGARNEPTDIWHAIDIQPSVTLQMGLQSDRQVSLVSFLLEGKKYVGQILLHTLINKVINWVL